VIRTYYRRLLPDSSSVAEERRRYRREWYAKNAERIRPIHREQQRAHVARKKEQNHGL
jgi:hypothetical protein